MPLYPDLLAASPLSIDQAMRTAIAAAERIRGVLDDADADRDELLQCARTLNQAIAARARLTTVFGRVLDEPENLPGPASQLLAGGGDDSADNEDDGDD